jgi:hypothetical protein
MGTIAAPLFKPSHHALFNHAQDERQEEGIRQSRGRCHFVNLLIAVYRDLLSPTRMTKKSSPRGSWRDLY